MPYYLGSALQQHGNQHGTNLACTCAVRWFGRTYRGCLRSAHMAWMVQAMLDYDGDVAVSYDELVAAVRECWAAGRAVSGRGEGGSIVEAVLGRVASFLRSQRVSEQCRKEQYQKREHRDGSSTMIRNWNVEYGQAGTRLQTCTFIRCDGVVSLVQESARDVFYRFDRNGNGRLEARELARFLKAAMPELSPSDVR